MSLIGKERLMNLNIGKYKLSKLKHRQKMAEKLTVSVYDCIRKKLNV